MNVQLEIKLDEAINKNFLVFISTELTTKLDYELIQTDKLKWSFIKDDNCVLDVSHGYMKKEQYQEKVNGYSNRYETRERETFIPNVLLIQFYNTKSIEEVNNVFNIINKYANLIVNENKKEEDVNKLTELLEEVALDKE